MSDAKNETKNILIVGVGGQGALLVSSIIAQAAILAGFDVRTNEVHGMAQRGGSVLAQVRFGDRVYSPLVWEGTADVIIALEEAEALRHAHFLREGGLAVVSSQRIIPVTVSSGKATYPADIDDRLARAFPRLALIDALGLAHETGNAKAANVVTLGAAAREMGELAAHWNAAIESCVPEKHRDLNKRAFAAGGEL
jgi:indolepyruvate ferredoxin oxidoreductase, beta subunit